MLGLPRALLLTFGAAVLVAVGTILAIVPMRRDCSPSEVHLALTALPDEMAVSWRTPSSGCASDVFYAVGGDVDSDHARDLDRVVHGQSSTYNSTELCGSPAVDDFEVINTHSAVLRGLSPPGARVSYRVGALGPVRSFAVPLPVGDGSEYSFLAYGDMGFGKKGPAAASVAQAVERAVREADDRVIVHVGDLSYADGKWGVWEGFMGEVEPFASRVPYMISVGNHEYSPWSGARVDAWGQPVYHPPIGDFSDKAGGECGLATAWRFRMPGAGEVPKPHPFGSAFAARKAFPPRRALVGRRAEQEKAQDEAPAQPQGAQPLSPFWYSFEYGKVHFTVLSTEHDLGHNSSQHAWLAADLAGVDRCRTPWLLVFMHRPVYVPHPNRRNREFGALLRTEVEGLFSGHNVTAVVSGHLHLYSRTCTMFNGTCVADSNGGVPHLIVGTAGHDIGNVRHNSADSEWLEEYLLQYGFGRFTVHGDERLSFSFFGTDNATALDSVELVERGVCNRDGVPLAVV